MRPCYPSERVVASRKCRNAFWGIATPRSARKRNQRDDFARHIEPPQRLRHRIELIVVDIGSSQKY